MPEREFFRWQVRSFTVRLALDVVESLEREIQSPRRYPAEEHGGILFGRILDNDNIEVDGFEFYRCGHRRGIPYDLNRTERRRIQQRIFSSRDKRGREVLGFFRTHLRPGLFLDQRDFSLMSETFSDCPGIALLIRHSKGRHSDAGIFFWEDGDIDRKQSELIFPLNADALRAQGPIERLTDPEERVSAQRRKWELTPSRKKLLSGLAWLASGVLAFAMLGDLHERLGNRHQAVAPAQQSEQATLAVPPAVNSEEPNSDDSDTPVINGPVISDPGDSTPRSPFDDDERKTSAPHSEVEIISEAPRAQWVGPAEGKATTPASAAPVLPPPPVVASIALPTTTNPSPLAAMASEISSVSPPVKSPVAVDVSVETKQGGVLKRVSHGVGRVPLLGRLPGLRHDDADVVTPTASSAIEPQIPADLSKGLADEVAVDIAASIDETGAVKSTEITRGGDSQFSALAEDAVRTASWKPAHEGDRAVPMDIVVHYRFSPNREP